MLTAIKRALLNISSHGDTDIFPFPFERSLIQESSGECVHLLKDLHTHFKVYLAKSPPLTIEMLSQVGYTGFRKATLIEPFWNAYYLALVISLADLIEASRIAASERIVFSYRFDWSEKSHSLFTDSNWGDFRRESVSRAKKFPFVLQTDIADFYSRINHHRLENALKRLGSATDMPSRILDLLGNFSNTASYGLPIGGPASRILAELSLNDTDQHLRNRGIPFCRYADDYALFCDSKAEAYSLIVLLSEKLALEGLSLQKHKTRILSSDEFSEINRFLDPLPASDVNATEEQKLLNISIRYDPYAVTAEEDYEALKKAVQEVDIIGILSKEVGKTAIDQPVAKQAIDALRALDVDMQEKAVEILLDKDNLVALSPVFVTVMRAVRGVYAQLTDRGKSWTDEALIRLFNESSHLLAVELNVSYYIQALALRHSPDKESILLKLFEAYDNHYLRRQIILVMARWDRHYWLTEIKSKFKDNTEWERRAIIVASFRLGDEGTHWRRHYKSSWSATETIVRDWAAKRAEANRLDGIS